MPVARPVSLITTVILPAVLLTGCPGPSPEVRLTLCQEMTAIALGEAPAWRGTETHLHGYQDAVITVRFATPSGEGQATGQAAGGPALPVGPAVRHGGQGGGFVPGPGAETCGQATHDPVPGSLPLGRGVTKDRVRSSACASNSPSAARGGTGPSRSSTGKSGEPSNASAKGAQPTAWQRSSRSTVVVMSKAMGAGGRPVSTTRPPSRTRARACSSDARVIARAAATGST